MSKAFTFVGGAFAPMHARLMGSAIEVSLLPIDHLDPTLLQRARATWQDRINTEYRSAQLMNRLLMETLAAGDPFDVHAGIVELLSDELRHVALCANVVQALGATPNLPDTLDVQQPEQFVRMPPAQRALSIAISMLIVNETLSVGYIEDLAQRCDTPVIKDVLTATLADESEHDAFGAQYVKQALSLVPHTALQQWRAVAEQSYRAQQTWATGVIATIAEDDRNLDAFPDHDLITLGLFSQQRQALLFRHNLEHTLLPLLRDLNLRGTE